MRSALARVPKGQQTMVAAALRQAFLQHDVLAYLGFPVQHRAKLHSTNPLERLNKEVKRRADVVGIFPSEQSILRLIGAVLLEANDEWQLQHRYMQVEAMAELMPPVIEGETEPLSLLPRFHPRLPGPWPPKPAPKFHHLDGRYPSFSVLSRPLFAPSAGPRRTRVR